MRRMILLCHLGLLMGSAEAGRGVTLQVMVDRTMLRGTPQTSAAIRDVVLKAATRLVPGVDSVRVGMLCGAPVTVYHAVLGRDLGPLARVLDTTVLQPCAVRGSRLNEALRWASGQASGGFLLATDAAFSDDPGRALLPATVRQLAVPTVVLGARAADRDAFQKLLG